MKDPNARETARQFIGRLLRAVFEAPTGTAGAAELPHIFEQWRIEVLAAYELSERGKIHRIHEITRMHAGEYTGW
jgi:hypothetical protein